MVQLLKIKEHIYRFIGKYEIYTIAVFRFLVAFVAFTLINQKIGYMDLLQEYPIPLLFALLCSFLPSGMMLFLGAVLILLHVRGADAGAWCGRNSICCSGGSRIVKPGICRDFSNMRRDGIFFIEKY